MRRTYGQLTLLGLLQFATVWSSRVDYKKRATSTEHRSSCGTCSKSPLLRPPVRQRVLYKMAVLTRKTRTSGVPTYMYLNEHLVPHVAVRSTRSASLSLLTVPKLTTDFSIGAHFVTLHPLLGIAFPQIFYCATLTLFLRNI